MCPRLTRCAGYHLMATNKPHFRLTTYGKLNPGDLVWEPRWRNLRRALKVKAIKGDRNDTFLTIKFIYGEWMIRQPTDKCFASW